MRYWLATLMLLLSVIPVLVIYDLYQQNIEQLPSLGIPDSLYPLSFICIGLIVILAFLLSRHSHHKESNKRAWCLLSALKNYFVVPSIWWIILTFSTMALGRRKQNET